MVYTPVSSQAVPRGIGLFRLVPVAKR